MNPIPLESQESSIHPSCHWVCITEQGVRLTPKLSEKERGDIAVKPGRFQGELRDPLGDPSLEFSLKDHGTKEVTLFSNFGHSFDRLTHCENGKRYLTVRHGFGSNPKTICIEDLLANRIEWMVEPNDGGN